MDSDPRTAAASWNDPKAPMWQGWADGWLADEIGRVPAKPGAYILGLAKSSKRSVVIPRLVGLDRHGVLDIGESKNLRHRVALLRRCITVDGHRGHMAGWRYSYLRLRDLLGGRLYLSWCTDDDCYRLEGDLLHAYVTAFRELPPLNYKFNWSRM